MHSFVKPEPDIEINSQYLHNDSSVAICSNSSSGNSPKTEKMKNHESKRRNSTIVAERNNLNQLKSFLISTDPIQIPLKPGINTPEKVTTNFVKREPNNDLNKPSKENKTSEKLSHSRIEKTTATSSSSLSSSLKKHRKDESQLKKSKDLLTPTREETSTQYQDLNKCDTIPKNPLALKKLKNLLFDINPIDDEEISSRTSDLLKEVFEGLDDEQDLSFCKGQVDRSLDEWINYGEELNNRHLELTKQLVQLRIELSYKFRIIIELINDNSDYLMQSEKSLDEKLDRIKVIGNDILNLL
ncbi:similar to Saccharomyces cerevisiae YDR446W ECM11 Non-essential protein apparently involved in meiosis, GFP fusion protein is present in discrete clusters in the nucleus throughout mitosis [Maudiozyma barnettii]|uniref:Similar to Saccharomyces cerevisiae YDR446W ECM11 Non-essential protein apparently involved in meiosis, GFP fusion protein is present in discrete clusters in the nucleus throughout mitosis n=1 Tax=Maudiozyma barnettii TaxID=61262 RepID=A0A8H2VGL2_9SACH|nr:Ecm11p [Kazachstania barnettii]CAB4255106.1 similar to Saccharomyces cerevisiae YDR446W ECM11 Non-essential protein apparently involved in meiosis, GFP fusion protein is present in discrete clusters in the nucleus throughout mitosis [Kazachstania barnettii]CAD1783377.1 similar to Saccharomyces cerevisiae YDR446W ECM11 Non-essential protein apparently involved in meiosis, GFP fusion protein is present in discrete clusters in the nucleus throughout mitosis [Kazachstania barnettii]